MTRRLVPFAYAGPIDFCKRRASSCEAATGQEQTSRQHQPYAVSH